MSRVSIIQISWEIDLVVTGYFVYTIARGFVHDNQALAAFDNAFEVARIEQATGVFTEARLQDWFYVLGYWPIILSGAVFLSIK